MVYESCVGCMHIERGTRWEQGDRPTVLKTSDQLLELCPVVFQLTFRTWRATDECADRKQRVTPVLFRPWPDKLFSLTSHFPIIAVVFALCHPTFFIRRRVCLRFTTLLGRAVLCKSVALFVLKACPLLLFT